jgi:beta-glucanase (GH16 family)
MLLADIDRGCCSTGSGDLVLLGNNLSNIITANTGNDTLFEVRAAFARRHTSCGDRSSRHLRSAYAGNTAIHVGTQFRARLPHGRGLWPALWLRTPPQLPLDGEIDVIEGYGSHPNLVQSTLHPWTNGKEPRQYCAWLLVQPHPDSPRFHRPDCQRIERAISLPRDLAADFHVYAVDWTSSAVTWSLDGLPYFSVRGNVPQMPMVIIIQLPVSAHWDGLPDETMDTQSLDVDYVRVYEPVQQ